MEELAIEAITESKIQLNMSGELDERQYEAVLKNALKKMIEVKVKVSSSILAILWEAEKSKVYLFADQQYLSLYDWFTSTIQEVIGLDGDSYGLSQDYIGRIVKIAMTILPTAERLKPVTKDGIVVDAEAVISSASTRKMIGATSIVGNASVSDETNSEMIIALATDAPHKTIAEIKKKGIEEAKNSNNPDAKKLLQNEEKVVIIMSTNEDGTVTVAGTMPAWKQVLMESSLPKGMFEFRWA